MRKGGGRWGSVRIFLKGSKSKIKKKFFFLFLFFCGGGGGGGL